MKKENTQPMASIVEQFVKAFHIEEGYRIGRVMMAWDEVLKEITAGAYPPEKVPSLTTNKFFKDGVFTFKVSSSLLRMQLQMNSESILKRLNDKLSDDHKVSKLVIR